MYDSNDRTVIFIHKLINKLLYLIKCAVLFIVAACACATVKQIFI